MSQSPFLIALLVWSSMAVGNFAWQWLCEDSDYAIASSRSYWQLVAVLVMAAILKVLS